jgi:ABC-type amino acid transport system permease subunit
MKGTGLGIAVGFAELFQVTVTSINQTGKSIDFLIVMMLIYGMINFAISKLMALANDRIRLRGRA